MGSSPPAPTDPKETSAAQTGSNVSTAVANAYMNNITEYTPDGSTVVNKTGSHNWTDPYTGKSYDIPTFTRTTTLSPEQQAIKAQTTAAQLNLAGLANQQTDFLKNYMAQPLDISAKLGAAPELQSLDFSADRNRVEESLFARQQPQQERDRAALETRLANQGIKVGSAAYNAAMDDMNRGLNDSRLATIAQAGSEQDRMVNLALADYQARMSGRQQNVQELLMQRNQPLNEISALMSGSQVSMPQFMGFNQSKIPTTDNAQIISNYDNQRMQAWQAQQQSTNGIIGGALGGIGSIFRLSDENAKTDMKPVATLYEYRYKGEGKNAKKHIGVKAQEIEKIKPDMVKTGEDGLKRVNYGALFEIGAN